jgi:DNA repair protein RecN (Recombination protein N)
MLTTLSIKNFTIVSELNLDFEPGMTAFTGETGAGKSIMLDAVNILLGHRAEPSMIRNNTPQCEISAAFNVAKNPDAAQWLEQQDIVINADEVILRLILNTNGRSKAYIQSTLFPLQKLKELGALLLHIHGQNEQYHLLRHDVHRDQLDAYAMNDKMLKEVKDCYDAMLQVDQQIQSLTQNVGNIEQKELLNYQLEELEQLALSDKEVQQLNQEHKLLSQANGLIHDCQQINQILDDESGNNLFRLLYQIEQITTNLPVEDHPSLKNFVSLLSDANIQLQEAQNELTNFQSQLELNPERLNEVELRIDKIYELARKHRVSPEALYEYQEKLQSQLARFTQVEDEINSLNAQKVKLTEQYQLKAEKLTKRRIKEAKALGKEITQLIHTLGMPNGEVSLQISPLSTPTATGLDKVEYFVSFNPGSSPKPLAKIASGGELSRVSLAIQVLTAEKKAYPTLMFDEVDSGIGGAVAAKVGILLRKLGQHTQVFCVTHQAQVASNANWHMKVEKNIVNRQTFSTICKISEAEKVEELARMLSGVEMTSQTLAHAKTLLEQAQ